MGLLAMVASVVIPIAGAVAAMAGMMIATGPATGSAVYGFTPRWWILFGAGILGAVLRLLFSWRDTTWSRVLIYDTLIGGLTSQLGIPALRAMPILGHFMDKIGDDMDDTAALALLMLLLGGGASFFVNQIRAHGQEMMELMFTRFGKAFGIGLLLLTVAAIPSVAFAGPVSDGACPGYNQTEIEPVAGSHEVFALTTVKSLTPPTAAVIAVLYISTNGMRWWDDGTVPTASVGNPVPTGSTFAICGPRMISTFQMISQTGTSDVTANYYRVRQ